jgi:endoglucanase
MVPLLGLWEQPLAAETCPEQQEKNDTAAFLQQEWQSYKAAFLQEDGRVIDHAAYGISTSEGQSYALLRSVWSNDPDSFNKAYDWLLNNLQGANPASLPAWRWGQREDESWGVIDPMAASDADLLIVWSLVLAHEKWKEPLYLERARLLMGAIWDKEVIRIGKRLTLLPGPWAQMDTVIKLNPSYFMPFVFRTFARLDTARPWEKLIDSSYDWLSQLKGEGGLPPDWALIEANTGLRQPDPADSTRIPSDFSFDAFRVVWTLAADARWYGDPRALAELKKMKLLWRAWLEDRHLPESFSAAGTIRSGKSYAGMYGAVLPALELVLPGCVGSHEASLLFQELLRMRQETGSWGYPGDYYAPNWVWFGVALWSGVAKPEGIKPEAGGQK